MTWYNRNKLRASLFDKLIATENFIMLVIKPISNVEANRAVKKWHRHNDPLPDLHIAFCYALYEHHVALKHRELLGVAIVGNPCGRTNRKYILEVRRVCFKPDEKFHKLRRHYINDRCKEDISLRQMPVLVYDIEDQVRGLFQGTMIKSYKIPSFFLQVAEMYTQQFSLKKDRPVSILWTYIQDTEDGRYIEEAGWHYDHYVKSRGAWHPAKRRFAKYL
tara:strand:- start:78 stop:734 length:657 start_codon:yes stop_codon:yes gene_type:complete